MKRVNQLDADQQHSYNVAHSCQGPFGEDPIQSKSLQQQEVKRPKSYRSVSDDDNEGQLTSTQKKQRKEMIAKDLGKNRKSQKDQNEFFRKRNDRQFVDDITHSQQVSIQQSSSADQNHNQNRGFRFDIERNQKPIGAIKRKQYFNLMLIGAASTGKTTYMQCILKQYKQKNHEKSIKTHTQFINQKKSPPISSNLSLEFYVVDTPGYTHSTIASYIASIQQQIIRRMQKTKKNKRKAMTESSVYERQEKQIRDERIHCCLFFLRGPRLHSDDWKLLQEIHDICNIIPVIAKGDSYTIQQIMELKKNITLKAAEEGIKFFNVQQYVRQKCPQEIFSITKGPYGVSPPFMISSSTAQIQLGNDIKIARQFKWGTCFIQDEQHTQFNTLKRLLIKHLHSGFTKMTDVKQEIQRTKIEKKSKNLAKYLIPLGLPIMVGAMVYFLPRFMKQE